MYCHCVIAYSFEVQNNITPLRVTALCPKINIGSTMSYFFTKCMFVKDMFMQWLSGRVLNSR